MQWTGLLDWTTGLTFGGKLNHKNVQLMNVQLVGTLMAEIDSYKVISQGSIPQPIDFPLREDFGHAQ